MKVLQFPLAKITLCIIAGILCCYAGPRILQLSTLFWFFAVAFTVAVLLHLFVRRRKKQSILFGVLLYLSAFLTGLMLQKLSSPDTQKTIFTHNLKPDSLQQWQVVVNEQLKNTRSHCRYLVAVQSVDGCAAKGKLLLQFPVNSFPTPIAQGCILKFRAIAKIPQPPKNPGQFDYGSYLKNHAILAQAYPDASALLIAKIPQKNFRYYAGHTRHLIISRLKESGLHKEELAIVAALVLGQKQELSADIMQDYQFAGAIHILSVSGLHVGFILLFLNLFLRNLPKTTKYRLAGLLITLCCLWGFALLTGFSPSVLRSVTMFSFVAVGMHLRRQTNSFHTLLVSMLLLLIIEPMLLFDVGFQLSYAAVFFIIWLQPIFRNIWHPNTKIVSYLWQIFTVSVAAQIGTLPLSLYYFHQFPGLFFATNLIIIPFLTVIMALAIACSIWAVFASVPALLIAPLGCCITMLNSMISAIASVESLVFREIAFNGMMLISLYLLISAFFSWFALPRFQNAVAVMVCALLTQFAFIYTFLNESQHNEFAVFNVYKGSLISLKKERSVTGFTNQKEAAARLLQPYARSRFSTVTAVNSLPDLLYFKEKRILIINESGAYPKNCRPDVLILRNSPKINLERLLQQLHPEIIVADGSNFTTYVKLWQKSCNQHRIAFHDTHQSGSFGI